nr:hypothetical protein [bacterium]
SGKIFKAAEELDLELGPYKLCSLCTSPETEVRDFYVIPPAEIVVELNKKFIDAKESISRVRKNKAECPISLAKTVAEIDGAMKDGRYAAARKLLNSYAILKAISAP